MNFELLFSIKYASFIWIILFSIGLFGVSLFYSFKKKYYFIISSLILVTILLLIGESFEILYNVIIIPENIMLLFSILTILSWLIYWFFERKNINMKLFLIPIILALSINISRFYHFDSPIIISSVRIMMYLSMGIVISDYIKNKERFSY